MSTYLLYIFQSLESWLPCICRNYIHDVSCPFLVFSFCWHASSNHTFSWKNHREFGPIEIESDLKKKNYLSHFLFLILLSFKSLVSNSLKHFDGHFTIFLDVCRIGLLGSFFLGRQCLIS